MPDQSPPPPATSRGLDTWFLVGGIALLAVVLILSRTAAADYGDALTRNMVRLSLGWFAAAMLLMTRLQGADWAAETTSGRLARWCWTWGIASFLVHLAMAFHFFHDWSPVRAFEHTRAVSGWGEGIYVSYAFTWLWLGDAAWWWLRPAAYAARSPWMHRAIVAFMLFMVFNGTVVFEPGAIRRVGLVGFVVLAIAWLASITPFSPRRD